MSALKKYPKKHHATGIISPQEHFAAEMHDYIDFVAPNSVILCFESWVMDHYRKLDSTVSRSFWTGELISFKTADNKVALVGNFGIGGAAAVHILEILIAAGVKKFVVVGLAGGLQKNSTVGTLVVVDKALRDEGVSDHYLPQAPYVNSNNNLTYLLETELKNSDMPYLVGSTWSVASMYRETKEEILYYAKEGILTVEMELASLFAVAEFRKAACASILVISDYVGWEQWEEQLHGKNTKKGLLGAIELSKNMLFEGD